MTVKRTFSLPDEVSGQLDQVAGSNASAWVAEAIRERVSREAAAARIRDAYGDPDPVAYEYWMHRLGGAAAGVGEVGAAGEQGPRVRAS